MAQVAEHLPRSPEFKPQCHSPKKKKRKNSNPVPKTPKRLTVKPLQAFFFFCKHEILSLSPHTAKKKKERKKSHIPVYFFYMLTYIQSGSCFSSS
jgi:hypothetical protein